MLSCDLLFNSPKIIYKPKPPNFPLSNCNKRLKYNTVYFYKFKSLYINTIINIHSYGVLTFLCISMLFVVQMLYNKTK